MVDITANIEFFVDSRTSKNNKTYYGLYVKIGDSEELIKFISKKTYDYIKANY